VDIETQLDTAGLFEQVLGQTLERIQAEQIDKQELVLEGEIFLQVALATEGVERVGDQRLVFVETHRLHIAGG
jgi:hypothetical protein